MIRLCAGCRRFLGVKRPWFTFDVTHGLCPSCFRKVWTQLDPLRQAEIKVVDNDQKKMLEDAP